MKLQPCLSESPGKHLVLLLDHVKFVHDSVRKARISLSLLIDIARGIHQERSEGVESIQKTF